MLQFFLLLLIFAVCFELNIEIIAKIITSLLIDKYALDFRKQF